MRAKLCDASLIVLKLGTGILTDRRNRLTVGRVRRLVGQVARAHKAGLQVLLDFHYSDDWADGDKQNPPAAWVGLTDAQQAQGGVDIVEGGGPDGGTDIGRQNEPGGPGCGGVGGVSCHACWK